MLGIILYLKFLDSKRILKLFISLFCSVYFGFKLNLTFCFKKCPECYDTDFCHAFENRLIQFTWFSYLLSAINPNLTKSVFLGVFNGSRDIVVKRKAGRSFRHHLCKEPKLDEVFKDVELDLDKFQSVILCPGFVNVNFLYGEDEDLNDKRLWFDVKTSIEPLLLKFFRTNHNKWPVPKYYGACGDFIVEEYKGEPLINFISSSFETQAYLASQLLKIAHMFTFNHSDYIFYFTDYSLDNFVVDSSGSVTLVDLDNVIIFNKTYSKDKVNVKNSIHISKVYEDHKYIFSPSDICSHYLSDHNYFSVCKFLLAKPEGLLSFTPEKVQKMHPELLYLLNECSESKNMESRISAGQKLEQVLCHITKDYKWSLKV